MMEYVSPIIDVLYNENFLSKKTQMNSFCFLENFFGGSRHKLSCVVSKTHISILINCLIYWLLVNANDYFYAFSLVLKLKV